MRASRFWHTMAKRFESLRTRYGDFLAATSCRAPLNDGPATWSFLGSTRKRELERFELLAAHAALELGCPAECARSQAHESEQGPAAPGSPQAHQRQIEKPLRHDAADGNDQVRSGQESDEKRTEAKSRSTPATRQIFIRSSTAKVYLHWNHMESETQPQFANSRQKC